MKFTFARRDSDMKQFVYAWNDSFTRYMGLVTWKMLKVAPMGGTERLAAFDSKEEAHIVFNLIGRSIDGRYLRNDGRTDD